MRTRSAISRGLSFALLHTYGSMGQTLPYIPTSIFLSTHDANVAYIFQPSTDSQAQLVSLNISSSLQTSGLSTEILTSDLPFLESNTTAAFTPLITSSGDINVWTGSCSSSASLWTYQLTSTTSANGTWSQIPTTSPSYQGANFLASGFSFSTLAGASNAQYTYYIFGGMCPTNSNTTSSTWQSAALYSNSMLQVSPSSASYTVSLGTSSGNVPIAEAGFSVTGLTPTYSNSTAGVETQAQNFVLLGGHTQTAFINMSQVAIYSLPQENWSFQTIDAPTTTGNTELAIKSSSTTETPDSRSGHTAILTSDGGSIIVFGGWVGDIDTPASPQLAILRLGSGYGGTGDWAWEIPTVGGNGLAAGQGIYGHGAVMLPGNVMMFAGGNIISASSSRIRRAGASHAYFLNTTSMNWQSSYTNPSAITIAATGSPDPSTSSDSAKKSKQVGLGAGLGIGLTAVVAAILVYLWYKRRLSKRRFEGREKYINELARRAQDPTDHPFPIMSEKDLWRRSGGYNGMMPRDGTTPWVPDAVAGSRSLTSDDGKYLDTSYDPGRYENDFGTPGSSVNVPRKPLNARNARGYYQPAPTAGFDFGLGHGRANSLGTAGAIHPIYEADEDTDVTDAHLMDPSGTAHAMGYPPDADHALMPSDEPSDPFVDQSSAGLLHAASRPTHGLAPVAATPAQEREREIASWVADWAAADALNNQQSRAQYLTAAHSGRTSPSKDSSGRTRSDLSEGSIQNSTAALSRNNSTQRSNSLTAFLSGAGNSWNPFSSSDTRGYRADNGGNISPESDRSGRYPPASAGSGTSSFTTAQTSQSQVGSNKAGHVQQTRQVGFSTLQAEGQSLLLNPKAQNQNLQKLPKLRAFPGYFADEPTSPSKTRRRPTWLGSLKRVFTGDDEWMPAPGSESDRDSPTYRDRSPTNPGFNVSGSETVLTDSAAPQRSASAGAMLWRRKQGREDWEDSVLENAHSGSAAPRANTLTETTTKPLGGDEDGGTLLGRKRSSGEDDEWDIETAVRSRVVQVMFTVPKEKLRVVNHDFQGDEDDDEALHTTDEKGKNQEELPDIPAKKDEPTNQAGVGERIEGRKVGEVVGRAESPNKRRSKVLEMVEAMEREKAGERARCTV